MPHFADFDTRGYRTVDARMGYAAWVPTYERTVEDAMDLALLDRLTSPSWSRYETAADLACGTGRTGSWLAGRGVGAIDGVDITPEMLEVAAGRGVFRSLAVADVTATGLDSASYDLVTMSLADEHLAALPPLYAEAARLTRPGGTFVLVGYHPHFIMASGMPTHFTNADGESIAIETHLHLISDHITAGIGSGWALAEMREATIDDAWLALKPKWERFRGHPITFALAWRKAD